MSVDSKNVNTLPITVEFHNPWVIDTWRMNSFRQALIDNRPQRYSNERDALDLVVACAYAAHDAGRFNAEEGVHVFREPIQKLIRIIGEDTFKSIYDAPPPEEVIDFALNHTDKWGRRMVLDEITVEVLRGRLEWQDRFAEAGVPTPEEYLAAQALKRVIEA